MHLPDLLNPARVIADLAVVDQPTLLHALADLLADGQPADAMFTSLCERERLGTTALGCGVAIPHARLPGLSRATGAFVRLATPITDFAAPFAAPDEIPIDLVFALAVPDHFTHQHLVLLSELAGAFGDPELRDQLRKAPDAATLLRLLVRPSPTSVAA